MLTFLLSMLISMGIVLIFRFINRPYVPPLLGIYQQKNKYYWFKVIFLFIVLNLRQWIWRLKRAYAVYVGKSDDGTMHVHEDDAILEQKQNLGKFPLFIACVGPQSRPMGSDDEAIDEKMSFEYDKAVDATFFCGVSMDGDVVSLALGRRQNNVCDAMACIKINGEKYMSPKFPDIYLEQDEKDWGEFRVQGIRIENISPMQTWKLSYNGEMRSTSDPEKTVKIDADFTWSALFAPFNYGYQMSPWCVASDMAREPWSSDYFKTIEKLRQSHYEQMGSLKGTINVDGKEHAVKMLCFRDHSFGQFRDWRIFHRYVFFTFFFENGDCAAIGFVSQPFMTSHLTIGFICRKSDQAVFAVQSSDFKLYQHGENQITPKDYGFSFIAGGQGYTVRAIVDDISVGYTGKHRYAKFYDQWLTVEMNGVKGRGLGQWLYNNVPPSNCTN